MSILLQQQSALREQEATLRSRLPTGEASHAILPATTPKAYPAVLFPLPDVSTPVCAADSDPPTTTSAPSTITSPAVVEATPAAPQATALPPTPTSKIAQPVVPAPPTPTTAPAVRLTTSLVAVRPTVPILAPSFPGSVAAPLRDTLHSRPAVESLLPALHSVPPHPYPPFPLPFVSPLFPPDLRLLVPNLRKRAPVGIISDSHACYCASPGYRLV